MNNSPAKRSSTATTIMRHTNGGQGGYRPRAEDDISRMRIRFEDEMKQVEQQMSRLRSEFETGEGAKGHRPEHPADRYGPGPVAIRHEHHPPTTLQTPLIRDDSTERMFCLKFDVSQYLPEEISVKTVDDQLFVKAKHEERGEGRNVYREFNQDFKIPRNVDPQSITSSLSVDGILSVEAPKLNNNPAIEYRRSPR